MNDKDMKKQPKAMVDTDFDEIRARAESGDADAAEALKDMEDIFSFLQSDSDDEDGPEDNPYDEMCGEYYDDFESLCEAAEKGDPMARDMQTAIYYQMGDIEEAVDSAMQSALGAQIEPLKNLAVHLMNGFDGQYRDTAMACNLFRAGAQMGDGFCAYNAGICCHKALGCPQDSKLALELFTQAAEMGFEDAYEKMELVCTELFGENGIREYLSRVEQQTSHRNPGAYYALYKVYSKEGSGQNTDRALACLFRACEGGSSLAALSLAEILKEGKYGFIPNAGRAMSIYQSLSDEYPEACYELAVYYRDSEGREHNPENAFKYMKKAVDMGYAEAVRPLAEFYMQGFGCRADRRQAEMLMQTLG